MLKNKFYSILVAIIVGLAEYTLLYDSLVLEKITTQQAIFFHGVIVLLLLLWVLVLHKKKKDITIAVLLTLLTATMGIIGVVASLLIIILYIYFKNYSVPFAEWFNELFPEEDDDEGMRLYDHIIEHDDITKEEVEPFNNIFHYGSFQQKQMAISKIIRHFHPRFAPILREATQDENNAIRVQAATAMAKLENNFMNKYIENEKAIKRKNKSFETLVEFAEYSEKYIESGILDQDRIDQITNSAINAYVSCQQMQPENTSIMLALARLYSQQNKLKEASKWYEKAQEQKALKIDDAIGYMEVLFKKKRYDKVRKFAQAFKVPNSKNLRPKHQQFKDLILLWSKGIESKLLTYGVPNDSK